jgi:hypothetical protein
LTHTLDTRSRFGCAEERIWPCTIGMNKKGGMTDVEFEKYIDTSIVPLFPALEDTKGKRVLLKVDSGLGRNGRDLLMKCRFVAYMFTPACRMPPPCNRRQTATTVRSSSSFATTSGKYHRLSTLPIYRYPSTRQRLGSSFMVVPSQWAPGRPSLAEMPSRRRSMRHRIKSAPFTFVMARPPATNH